MNDLPRVATRQRGGRESNPRPVDCRSIALTTTLPSRTLRLYAGHARMALAAATLQELLKNFVLKTLPARWWICCTQSNDVLVAPMSPTCLSSLYFWFVFFKISFIYFNFILSLLWWTKITIKILCNRFGFREKFGNFYVQFFEVNYQRHTQENWKYWPLMTTSVKSKWLLILF